MPRDAIVNRLLWTLALDAGMASTTWATAFNGDHDLSAAGLGTLAGAAGFAVGGSFTGALALGPGTSLSSASGAFFLARLAADGSVTGKPTSIDGLSAGDIAAMAAGPAGDVALAGSKGSDDVLVLQVCLPSL